MNKVDVENIAIFTFMSIVINALGYMAVPVLIMVGASVIDYITGLIKACWLDEKISSYKSIRGIVKKILMWTLVPVVTWIDMLVDYCAKYIRPDFSWPFVIAIVVAVWLAVNEIISIIENLEAIGVRIPPFLKKIVKRFRKKVEKVAEIEEDDKDDKTH